MSHPPGDGGANPCSGDGCGAGARRRHAPPRRDQRRNPLVDAAERPLRSGVAGITRIRGLREAARARRATSVSTSRPLAQSSLQQLSGSVRTAARGVDLRNQALVHAHLDQPRVPRRESSSSVPGRPAGPDSNPRLIRSTDESKSSTNRETEVSRSACRRSRSAWLIRPTQSVLEPGQRRKAQPRGNHHRVPHAPLIDAGSSHGVGSLGLLSDAGRRVPVKPAQIVRQECKAGFYCEFAAGSGLFVVQSKRERIARTGSLITWRSRS